MVGHFRVGTKNSTRDQVVKFSEKKTNIHGRSFQEKQLTDNGHGEGQMEK